LRARRARGSGCADITLWAGTTRRSGCSRGAGLSGRTGGTPRPGRSGRALRPNRARGLPAHRDLPRPTIRPAIDDSRTPVNAIHARANVVLVTFDEEDVPVEGDLSDRADRRGGAPEEHREGSRARLDAAAHQLGSR